MKHCMGVTVRATPLPVAMPPTALMLAWSDHTDNNESTQFLITVDHQLGRHQGLSWMSCDLAYWCPSQHHSYWCQQAWHLRWVPHTAVLQLLTGSDHRCYHQGWLAHHRHLYTHSTVNGCTHQLLHDVCQQHQITQSVTSQTDGTRRIVVYNACSQYQKHACNQPVSRHSLTGKYQTNLVFKLLRSFRLSVCI